jgi:FkbM family methyltransferase
VAGKCLRLAGWERKNPFVLRDVFGFTLFPAELGVVYQNYCNKNLSDFKSGEFSIISQIPRGGVCVDLGANVGLYSILMAKQVGNEGEVYSFEPGKIAYCLMKANIEINQLDNITPINVAVSDKSGLGKLFVCGTGDSDNTLGDTSNPNDVRAQIDIDLVALDDYFKGKKIDFIKMDIQGSEYLALKGANRILKNNPHIKILMEYCPHSLIDMGVSPAEFLNYVRSIGFDIELLSESSPTRLISDNELIDLVGPGKKYSYVDVLLTR